jgi:hypothetical protein
MRRPQIKPRSMWKPRPSLELNLPERMLCLI